jgi:transposase
MKKYILNLAGEERAALEELTTKKRVSAVRRQRAGILLKADDGLIDSEIADELGVGRATVERIRKRAVLEGIEAAIERRPQAQPSRQPKLDGRAEARLIQIACSDPPEGQARWTLSLLADRLVELEVVDSVCNSTIRRRLKKTASSRGR